jgi:hypothetical protein
MVRNIFFIKPCSSLRLVYKVTLSRVYMKGSCLLVLAMLSEVHDLNSRFKTGEGMVWEEGEDCGNRE